MYRFSHRNVYVHIQYLKRTKEKSFGNHSVASNEVLRNKEVSSISLKPKYSLKDADSQWYEWWDSKNYFKPGKSVKDSFIILLPPPNITGTLHLGHILTITIQDVILRWRKMKGESVLWIPGIDHAGIATQVVVERNLKQNTGLTKYDLGREKFLEEIWKWKSEKENIINEQLKKMGASLDWNRLLFTMDPAHSQLVNDSFIKLYNQGLIYRSQRLINWSCSLNSSISDIEVDKVEIKSRCKLDVPGYDKPVDFGVLYKFAYKVVNEDDEIVVSTTRPETMLGDVAVAVHPNDPRYSKYINKKLWHPFRNEEIPIIFDEFVDQNFGSGAVKITPSHSQVDFEVGVKHNLKSISVINENGCINKIGRIDHLHGMKRFDARSTIVKELKALDLFRGYSNHEMILPICSRSGDVIELIAKDQWYLKCKDLANKAIEAVETGKLRLHPSFYIDSWNEWLKNIRDWNLSRQLWWGHQVPMYECSHGNEKVWLPARNLEEAKKAAEKKFKTKDDVTVIRDPDVLDTWFSSGLLPLSISTDFGEKPPISLMVTGNDILFFWVARMVMLSIQLTGKLPFNEVLLHGLVCDSEGKKMSKSLGNVIKPENIINGCSLENLKSDLENALQQGLLSEKNFKRAVAEHKKNFPKGIPEIGVDGLRLALCSYKVGNQLLNFDWGFCLSSRHFCNKIWQAINYYIKIVNVYESLESKPKLIDIKEENLGLFDKWILSRLASTLTIVNKSMEVYDFAYAVKKIQYFVIEEFCSIYLESTKPKLKSESIEDYRSTVAVFHNCVDCFLKILSPFMPFVTEHLYHALPLLEGFERCESLTIAEYPKTDEWNKYRNLEVEDKVNQIMGIINAVRKIKEAFNLKDRSKVLIECSDNLDCIFAEEMKNILSTFIKAESIQKVCNFSSQNFIEERINDNIIVHVENPYDSESLKEKFNSILDKHSEKKQELDALLKEESSPDFQKKSPGEKNLVHKKISKLERDLEKIKQVKKLLQETRVEAKQC